MPLPARLIAGRDAGVIPVTQGGEARVHDVERMEFVEAHLAAILDAVDKGIDVRGYFSRSLLDNFEGGWGE